MESDAERRETGWCVTEKEAIRIEQNKDMPRLRVTMADISEVKRRHILENLCYSPDEAGAIFGKSGKWALGRVKDGKLIAVDDGAKEGENGLRPSQGIRITAVSVEAFRREYEIDPARWAE
jgi:hypothetical protein